MIDEEEEEESWSPSQRAVNKGSALDQRLQRAFQFSIPPAACCPEWMAYRPQEKEKAKETTTKKEKDKERE